MCKLSDFVIGSYSAQIDTVTDEFCTFAKTFSGLRQKLDILAFPQQFPELRKSNEDIDHQIYSSDEITIYAECFKHQTDFRLDTGPCIHLNASVNTSCKARVNAILNYFQLKI